MKINSEDTIKVYCTCRMPEIDGIDMVQCSRCNEWYHVGCVTVPDQAMEDSGIECFCLVVFKTVTLQCRYTYKQ